MKKIFIILGSIILLAIFGLFGWYLFIGNEEAPTQEIPSGDSPFGSDNNSDIINGTNGTDITNPGVTDSNIFGEPITTRNKLIKISTTPVAGFVALTKGTSTLIRYADRATGHIYEASLSIKGDGVELERTKITNNTLPKIYEAHFRPDGNAVLFRSLKDDTDTVENMSLTLTPPQSTSTEALYSVSSTQLRGNTDSVTVGSGNTLFYVLKDNSSIVSSAFNGSGLKTLFDSSFSNWRLASAGNALLAYTKATASANGYAYLVNTSNGNLSKVAGPLLGLVAIPNASSNRIAYSYTQGNTMRLLASDGLGKTISEITPATLAEKCTWAVGNIDYLYCGVPTQNIGFNEPDNWYRGSTHFSDRIWLFDTKIQTAQVLIEPKTAINIDIDVSEPRLSPGENYLVFINRNDLSLWALRLK